MKALFKCNKFGDFYVRKAQLEDTEAVIKVLRDAATWIKSKGISQWEHIRSGKANSEIKQGILAGTTYVVEGSQGIVATFNLSDRQNDWDIMLWRKRDDDSFYIHRLAIDQDYRKQQIGRKLLDWMGENIAIENRSIRLDCVANNCALNSLYQCAGFTFVANVAEREDSFSIYEKSY